MPDFYALRCGGNSPDLAYVVGVMLGDGCCYRISSGPKGRAECSWRIELKVKDRSFADAFAQALQRTLKRPERRRPTVFPSGVHYWRVSVASRSFGEWWEARRVDLDLLRWLVEHRPAEFLRGLYDSEGNLTRGHSVRIVSQRPDTLRLAAHVCQILGLGSRLALARPAGRLVRLPDGRVIPSAKDLWVLSPRPMRRFLELVGSSIERKAG